MGETRILDWRKDHGVEESLKAIELHSIIRGKQAARPGKGMAKGHRAHWRKTLMLSKLPLLIGAPLNGRIIEVGAGAGWLSANLVHLDTIKESYILENDPVAVHDTMPRVFDVFESPTEKITRVLGTFHHMPKKNAFDFYIATGALHHSADLNTVFSEAFHTIKPGGWLIASEPIFPNNFSSTDWKRWRNTSQGERSDLDGRVVTHGDMGNYPWRLCDFESAAYAAGFDVVALTFRHDGAKGNDKVFKDRQAYTGNGRKNYFTPYFASKREVYDALALFCQKPV